MKENIWVKQVERTETLNLYLDDIKKYDLITADKEIELIEKAQNGDDKAKQELMTVHQRYIFSFAKKFTNGKNVLDLVNEATIGFEKAIMDFDITRGFRLCSYANYWMREKITKYLISEHLTIKKSNYNKTHSRVNKVKNDFFLNNGRFPTSEEIIDILREKYDLDIKDETDVYDVVINSINSTLDDGETYFEESKDFNTATASYNEYENEMNGDYTKALVAEMIKTLNEKEQKIVKSLFGIGCEEMSMEDVAEEMGYSKERIRQLKQDICTKLKKAYSYVTKKAI
jgi:RNA polymerase primary sigma factor